jgi:hypothetical protein
LNEGPFLAVSTGEIFSFRGAQNAEVEPMGTVQTPYDGHSTEPHCDPANPLVLLHLDEFYSASTSPPHGLRQPHTNWQWKGRLQ